MIRTSIAVGAAAAALLTMLAGLVVPTARADTTWGAISITPDGKRWAVSSGQPTEEQAKVVANNNCGRPECSVTTTFTACAALAVVAPPRTGFAAATGPSRERAEAAVRSRLPSGVIASSPCNDGSNTGPNSSR